MYKSNLKARRGASQGGTPLAEIDSTSVESAWSVTPSGCAAKRRPDRVAARVPPTDGWQQGWRRGGPADRPPTLTNGQSRQSRTRCHGVSRRKPERSCLHSGCGAWSDQPHGESAPQTAGPHVRIDCIDAGLGNKSRGRGSPALDSVCRRSPNERRRGRPPSRPTPPSPPPPLTPVATISAHSTTIA